MTGRFELMKHQRRALHFLRRRKPVGRGRGALFMDPGTGKTLVAIRFVKPQHRTLLILRRDDFLTWRQQLMGDGVYPDRIHELPDDVDVVDKYGRVEPGTWWMITYDLMRNKKLFRWIQSQPFDVVVLDESDYMRGWQAARTRNTIRATRHITRRVILTGTPFGNEPAMDIFPQAYFLDDGDTFGKSYFAHRQRYYLRSGPGWYQRRDALERIRKKCTRFAFHVKDDDALDLPTRRYVVKSVPMTKAQARHYVELVQDWETELANGHELEVDYIVARLAKLRQIAGGFLYYEDTKGRREHPLPNNKLGLLVDLLTRGMLRDKPKVVVWAAHNAEVRLIYRHLRDANVRCIAYFEQAHGKAGEALRKKFRDDPHERVFIGQADRGRGMNELIVADTTVYYSNSLRAASRFQSERRIRRKGSEHHKAVLYVDLLTETSIDVEIHRSLKRHRNAAQAILQALQAGHALRHALGARGCPIHGV